MRIFKRIMATLAVIFGIIVAGLLAYISVLLISSLIIDKVSKPNFSFKASEDAEKYSSNIKNVYFLMGTGAKQRTSIVTMCIDGNLIAISCIYEDINMIRILNADGTPKMCNNN